MHMISRREWMAGALLAGPAIAAARPNGLLIDTHVHLFSDDPARFPLSGASYKPPPYPVEQFVKFAKEAGIDHAVIVHPEPYQDDHRYLEYCFSREPSKGFFKGTCLFDPIDPRTPQRMQALMKANPGRLVALRIHEVHAAGTPATTGGAIRDRDLADARMAQTWRAAHELGLAVQLHMIPHYALQVGELATKVRGVRVILDHLARPGQGTAAEYEDVLRLAKIPGIHMKFSTTGVAAASKQPFPHLDAKPLVKRIYEAFGPDRMVWAELGSDVAGFERANDLFAAMFDFVPETDRAKLRGLTAKRLFAFD
jgi:predicted TIM-barrel fold metal-dependent hydrolase